MNWEDVLKRDDIVGGDLETHESEYIYREPISAVWMDGGMVHFESPWCARMPADMSSGWSVWHYTGCFMSASIVPQNIANGRIQFYMPLLGFGIIFPAGGSKLDPARVSGLNAP